MYQFCGRVVAGQVLELQSLAREDPDSGKHIQAVELEIVPICNVCCEFYCRSCIYLLQLSVDVFRLSP